MSNVSDSEDGSVASDTERGAPTISAAATTTHPAENAPSLSSTGLPVQSAPEKEATVLWNVQGSPPLVSPELKKLRISFGTNIRRMLFVRRCLATQQFVGRQELVEQSLLELMALEAARLALEAEAVSKDMATFEEWAAWADETLVLAVTKDTANVSGPVSLAFLPIPLSDQQGGSEETTPGAVKYAPVISTTPTKGSINTTASTGAPTNVGTSLHVGGSGLFI